jgi:transcriptional regulator with XRE-family HTH domain
MQLSQALKDSIRSEMTRQGISERELARRLDWSQQYTWRRISNHENADKEITPTELEQIAEALGVPVHQLLPAPEPTPGGAR